MFGLGFEFWVAPRPSRPSLWGLGSLGLRALGFKGSGFGGLGFGVWGFMVVEGLFEPRRLVLSCKK